MSYYKIKRLKYHRDPDKYIKYIYGSDEIDAWQRIYDYCMLMKVDIAVYKDNKHIANLIYPQM